MDLKILLIDADRYMLHLLEELLRGEGYTSLASSDGDRALALFRDERPDLVIADADLSGGRGVRLCQEIRALAPTPVILTGRARDEDDLLKLFAVGADDFLERPVSPRLLLARVRALTRRAAQGKPPPSVLVRSGDLVLDSVRRELRGPGISLSLTVVEAEALRGLAAADGNVVPVAELAERVLGSSEAAESALLRDRIERLQERLEPDPSRPQYLHASDDGFRLAAHPSDTDAVGEPSAPPAFDGDASREVPEAGRPGAHARPFDLLESGLSVIRETLHGRRASLLALEDGDRMVVRTGIGLPPEVAEGTEVPVEGGIAGWVANHREPLLVRDLAEDGRFPIRGLGYRTASFVSAPVMIGGRVLAVVNVADRDDERPFEPGDLMVLVALADHLALCMENLRLRDEVMRLAATDPLLGVWNRRHFERRLEEELARAQRSRAELSLMMIDLDGFKTFNDTFGHRAGDAVLQRVAETIRQAVRTGDIVCRYGGDEFAVILPGTGLVEALRVAERTRGRVAAQGIEIEWAKVRRRFTVSIGVASFPDPASDKRDLVERADQALYQAKRSEYVHIRAAGPEVQPPLGLHPMAEPIAEAAPSSSPRPDGEVRLTLDPPDDQVMRLVPVEVARRFFCVPLQREGDRLSLAVAYPRDGFAVRVVSQLTGLEIDPVLSDPSDIRRELDRMARLQEGKSRNPP
ncbi:MAG: diguanylate cyclase [Anaerolineae bacterium]